MIIFWVIVACVTLNLKKLAQFFQVSIDFHPSLPSVATDDRNLVRVAMPLFFWNSVDEKRRFSFLKR